MILRIIRTQSIKRSFHCESWKKTHAFKPPVKLKADESCFCKHAGKSKEFYRYSSSTVNSSVTFSLEENSCSLDHLITNTDRISELSDDQLKRVIFQLRDVYSEENSSIKRLAVAIDEECVRRAKNWPLDTCLDILEQLFPKGKHLCVNLLFFLVKKKYRKALKSPIPTMVRYAEVVNSYLFWRKYHLNWYLVEFTLAKNLDKFSVAEMSILLTAFCNLRGRLTSEELMMKIFQKVIDNINETDSKTLSRCLQFFSEQIKINRKLIVSFDPLFEAVKEKFFDYDFSVARYIALLCTYTRAYSPELLDKIAQKLIIELPNVSVRPLEEVVMSLTYFNYNSRNVYQKVIDSFKLEPLQTDLWAHPKRLVKIIGQMSIVEVYPYEYINTILEKEFLQKTFGKKLNGYSLIKDVMLINDGVQLDCPDYQGNRLEESVQKNLHETWSSHLHICFSSDPTIKPVSGKTTKPDPFAEKDYELSSYNKTLLEARDSFYSFLGGPSFLHTCYVLPFLPRPNLLFSLDQQKNPVKIPDVILNSVRLNYRDLNKDLNWYVVLSASQHPVLKGDRYIILGKDIIKVRLLRKLNFNVIIIVDEIWSDISEGERCDYLNEFIV